MEHLYQSLHTSPQASLRGLSPLERSGLSITGDYIGMSGLAATRLSDPHLIPASLTSTDLAFSLDGSRLTSPRPTLRQSRKRALSSSPYSDSFDINSMIRFSPNSLASIMNGGSRSSSGSGSYGHLSAGAISPALGVPPSMGAATTQLQQLQAHLMRGATLPGSPFLPPSPLLQHSPAALPPHQSLFSLTSQPQIPVSQPQKPESEKKTPSSIAASTEEESCKSKKEATSNGMAGGGLNGPGRNGVIGGVPVSTGGVEGVGANSANHGGADEDNLKEEPEDFVETNCNWKQCSKEFNTQDELVKHINNDHIHANKKSFVCRWKDCSRDEKPFKAQYMLVVHMRRHTGEKPHRCTFEGCFKAYSRLENLKTHLRSHTGEKPYMCEYPGCTKAFSNASDRAKHQNRTHSNEKPYVCKAPGCTKRYTDPSSLRKHVKTVHGADFYASKKHKGNDHQGGNPGSGNGGGKDGNDNPEGSPHSDGGKGASSSSPSVKSEDPTSPRHGHSPAMVVGGSTPMDQSKLLEVSISDNNVSTTGIYETGGALPEEWDGPDDDLDASVDIPIVGSINGGGSGSVLAGPITIQEGNLRNRLKTRLQKKGLTNILPSIPTGPRKGSGNGTAVGELSQRITAMKMNGGQTTPQQARKNLADMQCRQGPQTLLQGNRRDSNSTVSTYYGSMRSDSSSHPLSRRGSELSQTSFASVGGRQAILSSPYDPISCGSSRRSSENSNYNTPSFGPMGSHFNRFQRRPMGHPEMYNTSNLVVQTQNMSLSQENLHNWGSNMSNASGGLHSNMDSTAGGGYFGCAGPIGPPTGLSRDGSRRASDPVYPMERGFSDPSQRMQKFNSYSNFNYRNPMGIRPSMTPPIYSHPNQGLQLDQVGEDEPIENKLILPDDMVTYLNQNGNNELKSEAKDSQPRTPATPNSVYSQQISSPIYSAQNITSPCYPNQGVSSPYPNQPLASPAPGYQYPQPSSGYSVPPSPAHPYNLQMNSPATPYNAPHPSPVPVAPPAINYTPVPSGYPSHQNMNGCYSTQQTPQTHQQQLPQQSQQQQQQMPLQQVQGLASGQHQQQQQQHSHYNGAYGQYPHQMMPQTQAYSGMMQPHNRFQHNSCNAQGNSAVDMGSNSFGPVHVCGHLAAPNLAPAAYQAPCNGCQSRGNSYNNETNHYHFNMNWQGNQANMNQPYGNHYCGQNPNIGGGQQLGMTGYQDGMATSHYNMGGAAGGMMSMHYPSLTGDVQCQDVSQSSQSRAAVAAAKSKAGKMESKVKDATGATKVVAQREDAVTQDVKNVQAKTELPKISDTKPLDTKNDPLNTANNNFMRTDTYERTLKYVQECQNWNTSTVKEEVSSTTDQKPVLNANGTVMGYNPPPRTSSGAVVTEDGNQPSVTSVPLDSTTATTSVAQAPSHANFCAPNASALPEAPNMVVNDMTSSLTSLQKENKYLQLLQ